MYIILVNLFLVVILLVLFLLVKYFALKDFIIYPHITYIYIMLISPLITIFTNVIIMKIYGFNIMQTFYISLYFFIPLIIFSRNELIESNYKNLFDTYKSELVPVVYDILKSNNFKIPIDSIKISMELKKKHTNMRILIYTSNCDEKLDKEAIKKELYDTLESKFKNIKFLIAFKYKIKPQDNT